MSGKIVIGDIHGALKALEQVIARMKSRPNEELIFLGDYVDGWSQSAQVIDYLRDLEKKGPAFSLKVIMTTGVNSGLKRAWLTRNGCSMVVKRL